MTLEQQLRASVAMETENARLREQLAACVTARDEANAAWAEKVRVLRKALSAFAESEPNCPCGWCRRGRKALKATR